MIFNVGDKLDWGTGGYWEKEIKGWRAHYNDTTIVVDTPLKTSSQFLLEQESHYQKKIPFGKLYCSYIPSLRLIKNVLRLWTA